MHYAVTDSGGLSPNCVQSKATVLYQIRASKFSVANNVYERVIKIAQGAALMTDTTVEVVFDRASSDFLPNRILERMVYEKFKEFGPPTFDKEDIEFAGKIRQTFTEAEKNDTEQMLCLLYGEAGKKIAESIANKEIVDVLLPYIPVDVAYPASTDTADVSWNAPTVEILTACFANNTPLHSWQAVAQGKMGICHKGMLHVAKVMALSAIELFENSDLLVKIKKEFKERLNGKTYVCPIPVETKASPRRVTL